MSEQSKKWKARLLSSSLPLEHEVAKVLSRHHFTTSFDYTYSRKEGDIQKEFSIDIHASAHEPFKNPNKSNATVVIISECKFREEGKIWAFLPDVNEPEYSNFTLGSTIKAINHFSLKRINYEPIYEFEDKFNFTEKGIEIGLTSGEVFDKDIRHGILQLKYGLPYIIKENIEFNVFNFTEESSPFFIIPILVTNADLYLFQSNLTTDMVKKIDDINEIAQKVPYIVYGSNPGPDFTYHHKYIFKKFNKIRFESTVELFEEKQKYYKDKKLNIYSSPIRELEDLAHSPKYTLLKYYSQFFICTLSNLDIFIQDLQKTISASLKRNTNKTE